MELQHRNLVVEVMPIQKGHYITALATQTDQIPLTRDEAFILGCKLIRAASDYTTDIQGVPV